VLRPGEIVPVFQPIVRVADGYVIGYEALARFPHAIIERTPYEWFTLAASCGLRVDLEVACWKAIAAQGPPPGDAMLFVNTSPIALIDPRLDAVRADLPERLVVELTEQDAVQDYEILRSKLQAWSNDGVRLAIDDTGAGYSSLQHVLQLAPDFLKLDRSMINGVDRERSRQALVRSLVAFAREVGAAVIAECVERPEELEVLCEAGIDLAQGWLLARPGPPWPLPTIQEPVTRPERPMPATISDDEEQRFQRALSTSATHVAAAEAVCEHLRRMGQLMPSVYVLRDGLLRCLAQCGYWQILDGFPLGVGVLSQAVATGETLAVHDVAGNDEFLEATPGVTAELAVPLRVGGTVVGGLNVESLSPLTVTAEAEIGRCAGLLSERLEQLGSDVASSPLARLARSSKQLAGLVELDDVRSAIVAVACQVSGMDSALLAQRDASGQLEIVATTGPLARAFLAIPSVDVARLAAMVDRVSSCYTAGDLTGRPVAGTETLRAAGAAEVAVLPLVSLGRRTGVLVVAHTESMRLSTDEIEPLELLAVESARSLDLAATVAAWRRRATRDPLTKLGNHSAFHEALGIEPRPCAVAIMDIDRFKSVNDRAGHLTGDRLLREVASAMTESLNGFGRAYRIGGDEFAAIMPGLELEAAELASRRLCRAVSKLLKPYQASISVGVTVACAAEAPHEFVDRADRLLYTAKRAGSGRVSAA
jgi:diguanylate cyclase (GGDEF)-like protein